jgi:hypothetical protein
MLNSEVLNQMAAAYEAVVEKRFKKLQYSVVRLDRRSSKKSRPDFLISDSSGPQLLCEVKTQFSAAYLRDKGVHISTLDEKFCNFRVLQHEIDLRPIDEDLADAVRKRDALVRDEKNLKTVPLVVAFVFDFFADFLHGYPRNFNTGVNGILTIEKDVARTKAFEKLSIEEQEQFLRTGNAAGLPPNSKSFALVRNKRASRRVPKHFQLWCRTEGYNESV